MNINISRKTLDDITEHLMFLNDMMTDTVERAQLLDESVEEEARRERFRFWLHFFRFDRAVRKAIEKEEWVQLDLLQGGPS